MGSIVATREEPLKTFQRIKFLKPSEWNDPEFLSTRGLNCLNLLNELNPN